MLQQPAKPPTKPRVPHEQLLSAIFSVVAALAILAAVFLGNWIFVGALLTILFSALALMAGFAVIQALFLVAAELSLLIFLAQSFCAVPASARAAANDEALKILLAVGLIYILVSFSRSLYELLKDRYKKIENRGWSVRTILFLVAFVAFTLIFVWEIYLVVWPIVAGLCVYR